MDTQYLLTSALSLFLLMAAWQDIRHYRIQNTLVITGALVAVIAHTALPGGLGFYTALLGWLIGLALLLPLYLLRVMGAGDIKLMAMTGAFLGPQAVVIACLYILITGGVLSVIVALWRHQLPGLSELFARVPGLFYESIVQWRTPKQSTSAAGGMSTPETALDSAPTNPRLNDASARMPYGVAIAIGALVFLAVDIKFPIL
ncbi:MAG: prepilin peptidase [Nitrosomonas sp.]|nr:A24 family peptidase [Nitrosomonas sp.]MDR4652085.1 A24 family peptidase [Nitrosomonas sp.]